MKIWQALRSAFEGWVKILRGDAGWPTHFNLSAAGLATAIVLFLFFALLAIAFASTMVGLPTLVGVAAGLMVQALSILALLIGAIGTRRAVPTDVPLMTLMVPGIYALTAYLILGTILSPVAGIVLPVLWIGLLYLFYRLGRMAAGWNIGVSAAFAVLTVALLVGMPMTLYMLTGPVVAPSP